MFPLFDIKSYKSATKKSEILNFLKIEEKTFSSDLKSLLASDSTIAIVIDHNQKNSLKSQRNFIIDMMNQNIDSPVIVWKNYASKSNSAFQLSSAIDLGSLLIDGLVDGMNINYLSDRSLSNQTSFGILQASRLRISKTEYISCPSCGRTLFNLQSTTNEIRSVTDHLKGVKIGIMGCIVNGPGEMADADYGYVGTGVGNISLYKGQTVVRKNIPSEKAVDALISLIKDNGDWVEPSED